MKLADMRVGVSRVKLTQTVNDIAHEFVVYTLTLPTRPRVQASFAHEGIAQKVVKIFKKELQVGDKTFDDQVYISTDTPEETAAFLKDEDVQSSIFAWCANGGHLGIHDRTLTAQVPGADSGDDPALVRLVARLLA